VTACKHEPFHRLEEAVLVVELGFEVGRVDGQ